MITIFTFQYGQIRNNWKNYPRDMLKHIYIPVWLDQKYISIKDISRKTQDLHSSMVRLEIVSPV